MEMALGLESSGLGHQQAFVIAYSCFQGVDESNTVVNFVQRKQGSGF